MSPRTERRDYCASELAAMACITHFDWIMDLLPSEPERLNFVRLMVLALDEVIAKKERLEEARTAPKKGVLQ